MGQLSWTNTLFILTVVCLPTMLFSPSISPLMKKLFALWNYRSIQEVSRKPSLLKKSFQTSKIWTSLTLPTRKNYNVLSINSEQLLIKHGQKMPRSWESPNIPSNGRQKNAAILSIITECQEVLITGRISRRSLRTPRDLSSIQRFKKLLIKVMVSGSWWIGLVDVNFLLSKQSSTTVTHASPWKVYGKHFIIPSTPPSTARSIPIFSVKSSVNLLLVGVLSPKRNSSKRLANAMTHLHLVLIN